ncbi:MAG: NUDIX hydrolase [Propionibacteriaceae bacterium]|jgi:ADP-ribose pyrophosphatase|nr:NUDIX hydrolase [Propionibacteriaceae bacterium]
MAGGEAVTGGTAPAARVAVTPTVADPVAGGSGGGEDGRGGWGDSMAVPVTKGADPVAGAAPALPGPTWDGADLADRPRLWPARELSRHSGWVTSFVTEQVTTPTGQEVRRDWLRHPGAVAVVALDDRERVAVVRQYRHPAAFELLEIPAGLLDVAEEDPLTAARRELAEEAQLQAADWRTLVDWFTSPGSSQEAIRVYLARRLSPTLRPDGFELTGEEAAMTVGWVRLDEAVAAVLDGRLQSPTLVVGLLALTALKTTSRLEDCREADAPWPARRRQTAPDRRWRPEVVGEEL